MATTGVINGSYGHTSILFGLTRVFLFQQSIARPLQDILRTPDSERYALLRTYNDSFPHNDPDTKHQKQAASAINQEINREFKKMSFENVGMLLQTIRKHVASGSEFLEYLPKKDIIETVYKMLVQYQAKPEQYPGNIQLFHDELWQLLESIYPEASDDEKFFICSFFQESALYYGFSSTLSLPSQTSCLELLSFFLYSHQQVKEKFAADESFVYVNQSFR
jgi:hypothetical protein